MEVIDALVIMQARMSSTRLPGKVMAKINGKPIIYWQIKRTLRSKNNIELVVATSKDKSDDVLVEFLESEGIKVFRGSLDNVYSRFKNIASDSEKEIIVNVNPDN